MVVPDGAYDSVKSTSSSSMGLWREAELLGYAYDYAEAYSVRIIINRDLATTLGPTPQ